LIFAQAWPKTPRHHRKARPLLQDFNVPPQEVLRHEGMTMSQRRPLLAGNWKMHGLASSAAQLQRLQAWLAGLPRPLAADMTICPPATLIASFAALAANGPIAIGAQDCHAAPSGAYTGDVSAPMLADAGARAVILGHSERRAGHAERDADVKSKAAAAHEAGLFAIVCVGETAGERRLGLAQRVVERQLAGSLPASAGPENLAVAYEPVWAIGAGLTPKPYDIVAMHRAARQTLAMMFGEEKAGAIRILYGGSVKPGNAAEILRLEGVDGALVGGASLNAEEFIAIAGVYLG
jgi:triosephosphate isomerase